MSPDIQLLTVEAYLYQGRLEMARSVLTLLKEDVIANKNKGSGSKSQKIARPSMLRCLSVFGKTIQSEKENVVENPNVVEKTVFLTLRDIMEEIGISLKDSEQEEFHTLLIKRQDYLALLNELHIKK